MILLLGFALMIVGYIGVFFGKLIKSAISRQREFLADASAVQFTRNPAGIAEALKKIGGFVKGSRIKSAHAEEASHFFFGDGVRRVYFNALATHPPIEERIRRIDPSFEGAVKPPETEENWGADIDRKRAELAPALAGVKGAERLVSMSPAEFVAQTGAPAAAHLAFARGIAQGLPPELVAGARDAYGARAIVYGLLLDPDKVARQSQLRLLAENAEPGVMRDLQTLGPKIRDLDPDFKVPLVDLCLPGLKGLSENQYKHFRDTVRDLVRADRKSSFFEFVLGRILMRHLEPHFFGIERNFVRYKSLEPVKTEIAVALSTLAHLSSRDEEGSEEAFRKAMAGLGLRSETGTTLPQTECTLAAFSKAIDKLASIAPKLKKKVLEAGAQIVLADREVEVQEAELLRAVADSLDCPAPPFLIAKSLSRDGGG